MAPGGLEVCATNLIWLFSVSSVSSSEETEETEEAPTFGRGFFTPDQKALYRKYTISCIFG